MEKKYNKPILITNVGNKIGDTYEGKIFADKARIILKYDVPVLFFANWTGSLKWIKNYPNSFFTNTKYFYEEYINNFNEIGLNNLKNSIEYYYHCSLHSLNDPLKYPLFEECKNKKYISELNCGKYEDFSGEIETEYLSKNRSCDIS